MTWTSTLIRLTIGRRIFSILIIGALLCAGLYGYFISSSVINILVRKEVERNIATVSSEISGLEAEYLLHKNEITLEYAYAHGFTDVTNKHFALRSSGQVGGLTLNRE